VPHAAYLQHLEGLKKALSESDRDAALAAAAGLEHVAKRYRTLLEQANDAILLCDAESSRLLEWNLKTAELLVYPDEGLKELSLSDLWPEDERQRLWEEFKRYQSLGRAFTQEVPIVRGDGETIYVDCSYSVIEFGERRLVQAILHDVTEKVRLIEQTREHADELERKNEALARARRLTSEFLGRVSHELRTPLNAIVGYASLLLDGIYGSLNAGHIKALEKIDSNAVQLLTLINQVLDLSRIEAGAVSVLSEDVDLVQLLDEVFVQHREDLSTKSVDYRFECESKEVICRTDPVKLRGIVRQLLSNAVKYTERGEVVLTLEVDRANAVVSVQDTGDGIPRHQFQNIFRLFHTGEKAPSRRGVTGPGLGLSVVKKMTDLLGGRIEVESELGKGTTFTLALPGIVRSVEDKEIALPETKTAEIVERWSSNIEPVLEALLVEDDPFTVEILTEYLERMAGCRVRKAYSGADAQLRLTERMPDLLFVDSVLPLMRGERILQYCEQLWGKGKVAMIVIAGNDLSAAEQSSLEGRSVTVLRRDDLRSGVLDNVLSPVVQSRRTGVAISR